MNVKKRKRFVGTICLMLSMVLLTVPMLGMAALPASAAAEEQPECICDTQCTAEHPNEACEVCMEDMLRRASHSTNAKTPCGWSERPSTR